MGFLGFILFGACIGCIEGSEDGVRQGILKGTFGCFSTIGSRFFEGACGSFRPRLDRRLWPWGLCWQRDADLNWTGGPTLTWRRSINPVDPPCYWIGTPAPSEPSKIRGPTRNAPRVHVTWVKDTGRIQMKKKCVWGEMRWGMRKGKGVKWKRETTSYTHS